MQKIRTRLVNFRVTEDEFEKLKDACDRYGARCLSDFARNVMLTSSNHDLEVYLTKVGALEERVATLEVSMSRLSNALNGLPNVVSAK